VSKHLKVLKEVGLVRLRSDGRRRYYRLRAEALRPIHDWVSEYEQLWADRLDRLDGYLEEVQRRDER